MGGAQRDLYNWRRIRSQSKLLLPAFAIISAAYIGGHSFQFFQTICIDDCSLVLLSQTAVLLSTPIAVSFAIGALMSLAPLLCSRQVIIFASIYWLLCLATPLAATDYLEQLRFFWLPLVLLATMKPIRTERIDNNMKLQ